VVRIVLVPVGVIRTTHEFPQVIHRMAAPEGGARGRRAPLFRGDGFAVAAAMLGCFSQAAD